METRNIVLANRGKETLNATLAVDGGFGAAPVGPVSIPSGGAVTVVVSFDPKEFGKTSGSLSISSNDPLIPNATVDLEIDVF